MGVSIREAGDTAAGGTACLSGFELLAVRNTAADFFYDFAQCCAHRNFNKTCICNLAAESEYLCTLGLFRAHRGKPVRTVEYYLADVCICFNIIYYSRLAEKTLDRRKRRTGGVARRGCPRWK